MADSLELDHFSGQIFNGLDDFLFLFFPGSAAQFTNSGVTGSGTDVFMNQINLTGRDMHDSMIGILNSKVFFLAAIFGEGFHAAKDADAVINMHDQITGFQIGKRFDRLSSVDFADSSAGQMLAKDFLMTKD